MTAISKRAQSFLDFEFKMEEYFKQVAQDPYHKTNNPQGKIDMGSSTNGIVNDLIMQKLSKVNIGEMPQEYFDTCEVQGPLRFRKVAAAYFNKYMEPKFTITPDDICVLAGAGACFESIGYSLVNPGEVILVPRPYYYQFDHEFGRVVGADLVTFPVCFTDINGSTECSIKKEDLQAVYDAVLSSGRVVKSLLIVSPNNPMGYVFGEDTLRLCVEFCRDKNLHLISDEIYLKCVFGEPNFKSALSVVDDEDILNNVHITWAFSKDFAVAGFRVGIIITKNQKLKQVIGEDLNKRVSTFTLYALEALLNDFNWLDTVYFPEFHKRLAEKTLYVRGTLEKLGVISARSNAGLFIWANFEKYLRSKDTQSVNELFQLLMNNGIYISPGHCFGEKMPGWFRVITSLEQDRLDKGLKRIEKTLKSLQE